MAIEELEDRRLLAGGTLSAATPFALESGTQRTIRDEIVIPSDVDLFALNLSAGDRVTVDVATQLRSSPLNSVVRVFDSAGNEIAFNDDFPGGFDSTVQFIVPTTGTFFVGVSSFGNEAYNPNSTAGRGGLTSGDFDLTISLNFIPPSTDGNDTLATADQIPEFVGGPEESPFFGPPFVEVDDVPDSFLFVEGEIESRHDVDLYAFELAKGDVLIPQVRELSPLESRLRIFDDAGSELATYSVTEIFRRLSAWTRYFFPSSPSLPQPMEPITSASRQSITTTTTRARPVRGWGHRRALPACCDVRRGASALE